MSECILANKCDKILKCHRCGKQLCSIAHENACKVASIIFQHKSEIVGDDESIYCADCYTNAYKGQEELDFGWEGCDE